MLETVGQPQPTIGAPSLSPNGRYLAYESDESGRYEIYVLSFPGGDGKRQVSVNGGQQARWRGDGRELYYVEGDTLMAVSVSTESPFTLGQPQPLFEAPGFALTGGGANGGYDVSADGQRFLTVSLLQRTRPVVGLTQRSRASLLTTPGTPLTPYFTTYKPR